MKEEVLKRLAGDINLICQLCVAVDKSYSTITRWIKNNDERLTTASCLDVICHGLDLSREEVLETSKL